MIQHPIRRSARLSSPFEPPGAISLPWRPKAVPSLASQQGH